LLRGAPPRFALRGQRCTYPCMTKLKNITLSLFVTLFAFALTANASELGYEANRHDVSQSQVESFDAASLFEVSQSGNCKAAESRCKSACNYPANVSAVICFIDCMKKAGCL